MARSFLRVLSQRFSKKQGRTLPEFGVLSTKRCNLVKCCNPVPTRANRIWQMIDVGSVPLKEFAYALSSLVTVVPWQPQMESLGIFQDWEGVESVAVPPLVLRRFPLQRGYARAALSRVLPFERKLLRRLASRCENTLDSPLICTTPFYAPVAERWKGPVIYYSSDLTVAYEGLDPRQVNRLDRRLCKVAEAVCPASRRIADYFIDKAGCDPSKITVIPNATRSSSISDHPLLAPAALPSDCQHLRRPVAGVIGNLSANMDWVLLAEAISCTPEISWLFVGPTAMPIGNREQAAARSWVQKHATFVGNKSYADLQEYARALDVAVLPYRKREPTFSGSSVRFYEHLATCRPMIATRGVAELMEKTPLVTLVDSTAEMRDVLLQLSKNNFRDGLETARWNASKSCTWEMRAKTLLTCTPY